MLWLTEKLLATCLQDNAQPRETASLGFQAPKKQRSPNRMREEFGLPAPTFTKPAARLLADRRVSLFYKFKKL